MKKTFYSLLLISLLVFCSCTRENAPKDIKKANHFTQLFYDQVLAGNTNVAVDSFFVDIANATGKKALEMLHQQYGALHSYQINKTTTLRKNTNEGEKMKYTLIISERYARDTILSQITINNQTGKLKIFGFRGNYVPKK